MTADEIKKLIEIEKRNFWETETKGKEIDDVIMFAINKAYLDMQPRTIKGLGKVTDFKDCICEMLKNEFAEYFYQTKKDEEEFKLEHHRMCKNFLKYANEKLRQHGVEELSYGKAQKVVNMIFKYLYCTKEYGEEKKEYFSYCHMPLDSFSLEWIYRALIKNNENIQEYENIQQLLGDGVFTKKDKYIKKDAIGSWSSLEYRPKFANKCTYSFYEELLEKEFVSKYNRRISALELDFYVWPRMRMILFAEHFLKTFKDEENDKEDFEISNNEKSQSEEEVNKYALENLDATLIEKLQHIKEITESAMAGIGVSNKWF